MPIQLGQNGADTITHIVSLLVILGLGLGFVLVLAMYNVLPNAIDSPTHAAVIGAVCGVMVAAIIGASYYSTQYTRTPSGQINIVTTAPDGTQSSQKVVPTSLTFTGPDGKPIVIPNGSILKS